MRAVFLFAFLICAFSEAGIYYTADETGNVTRHEGDTPYPPGAVWKTKCPRMADEKTLSIVESVVVVDPVKVNAAAALRGPAPEVFVPMLNSDGEPVGTARLIVDSDTLELVAVINSESPQRTWAEQKADFMAALSTLAARRATLAASRMAIKQTVLEGELSQDELDEIAALWPPWESGVAVAVDEIYSYNSALYRVVQAHTTQADWTPDVTPALFAVIAPPGVIAEWVQPTGGHDAYQTGDRVTHNGHTWVSTVDANVWEPGVYGWTQED